MQLLRISNFKNQLIIFAVLFGIYAVKALYRIYPLSGDEPQYLMDSYGITKFHSRSIENLFMQPEIVQKIYGSPSLSFHGILDSSVTYHGVGLSLLLMPAIMSGQYLVFARLTMVTIGAITFVLIYSLLNELKIATKRSNLIATLIVGTSPPIIFNVDMVYPELSVVLISTLTVLLILKFLNRKSHFGNLLILAAVSLLVNTLIWFGPRYLVIQISMTLVILIFVVREKFSNNNYKAASVAIILFITGFNFLYYLLKIENWYGTFNLTKTSPANMTFGEIYELKNNIPNLYQNFFNLFFGSVEGIIPWFPLGVLVLPATFAFIYRTKNKYKYLILPIYAYFAVVFLAVVAGNKGGDTPPIHYLLPIVPFFAISLTKLIDLLVIQLKEPVDSFFSGTKKRNARFVLAISMTLLIIGGIYSLDGTRNKGDIFIRAASQDQPILKSAKFLSKMWPVYQGPNTTSYSNAIPDISTWVTNAEGSFMTAFSQGFRPDSNYTNFLNVYNPTTKETKLTLNIYVNGLETKNLLCSKSVDIEPKMLKEIILPCNVYGTQEIVWELFSDNREIEFKNYNMEVSSPLKNPTFDDVGFTTLIIIFLSLIYARIRKTATRSHDES
jgi:hypothetical protein